MREAGESERSRESDNAGEIRRGWGCAVGGETGGVLYKAKRHCAPKEVSPEMTSVPKGMMRNSNSTGGSDEAGRETMKVQTAVVGETDEEDDEELGEPREIGRTKVRVEDERGETESESNDERVDSVMTL